jgi:hypothetical protein
MEKSEWETAKKFAPFQIRCCVAATLQRIRKGTDKKQMTVTRKIRCIPNPL